MPKLKPRLLILASSGRISAPALVALRRYRGLQLMERDDFRPESWRDPPPDLALIQMGARGFARGVALLDELFSWDPLLPIVAVLSADLAAEERRTILERPVLAHMEAGVEERELSIVVSRSIRFGQLLMEREQHWQNLLDEGLPLSFAGIEPRRLQEAASSDAHVLVQGEAAASHLSLARQIHRFSPRASGPFLIFRPTGLSESACRSQLFGSGAAGDDARRGLLPAAAAGSLTIVGASELPRSLQGELEMILADGAVAARLILLVEEDLETAVAAGRFHRGLYRRLAAEQLIIRPLVELKGGIGRIAEDCVAIYARKFGKTKPTLSGEALESLNRFDWPGGLGELEKRCELAVLHADSARLLPADFGLETDDVGSLSLDYKEAKRQIEFRFKRRFFDRVLKQSGGSVALAAKISGLPRSSLSTMLKRAGVRSADYRNGDHGKAAGR